MFFAGPTLLKMGTHRVCIWVKFHAHGRILYPSNLFIRVWLWYCPSVMKYCLRPHSAHSPHPFSPMVPLRVLHIPIATSNDWNWCNKDDDDRGHWMYLRTLHRTSSSHRDLDVLGYGGKCYSKLCSPHRNKGS
jgi:hypothetical protein